MGKKPRSQRRKKGSKLGELEAGGGEMDGGGDIEVLSETHTIADSFSTNFEDFELGDPDEEDIENVENFHQTASNNDAAVSAAMARHTKLVEALQSAEEIPTEKRSATREGYLRKLFRALTQFATGYAARETVASCESLVPACLYGLRGGVAKPAEQYAACRVLEATAVILGGDNDEYFESIEKYLRRVVMTTTRAVQVRGAALRTLCMANFICSTDTDITNSLLALCEEVCAPEYRNESASSILRATALDCWALLSTTIHDAFIAGDDDFQTGRGLQILPLLSNCLDHTSVELRSAAGECVALIHESRLKLGVEKEDCDNASDRRYRRGSWDGSEWEVIMDEVKQRVAELSVESGRHMSKKAKKEQRATFREFMATIVDDEPPKEVITFRGGTLELNSWKEVVQLNFIRHCLQGGFQIQLLTNDTLHAIFGADGRMLGNAQTLSQLEKRMIFSKTSDAAKAADQNMTKNRRNRNNVKNHFLTADGDDI